MRNSESSHENVPHLDLANAFKDEILKTSRFNLRLAALGVAVGSVNAYESFGMIDVIQVTQLAGLVHYSSSILQKFKEDATSVGGKFGDNAVYLAVGNLTGETFELLASDPTMNKHDVTFSGMVLLVPRSEIRNLEKMIKHLKHIPESRIKTTVQNADLSGLLKDVTYKGHKIDGILIANDDFNFAELVVPNESAASLVIK